MDFESVKTHPKKKRQILKTKQCVCVSNDSKVAETNNRPLLLRKDSEQTFKRKHCTF